MATLWRPTYRFNAIPKSFFTDTDKSILKFIWKSDNEAHLKHWKKDKKGGRGIRNSNKARCWWLTPGILATQEAEIRRIKVWSQPRQIVHETISWKNPSQKSSGGEAQGIGPEFKSRYAKKSNRRGEYEHRSITCMCRNNMMKPPTLYI
jgi:hypothetical protein